jgi:GntR family transcriptional repressor for pyruvate dehydrogenase complex
MEASALFQPIHGQRLSAQIAEQLQLAIFSGALAEGDRLPPERTLVERFQVSRTSVQEAIHMLELQGLVTVRRGSNGGAFVTKPDFAKVTAMLETVVRANRFAVNELYQARQLLEPGIAALAARVATPADIAMLRSAVEASKERFTRGESHSPLSHNFHYLIARATGNDVFVMLVSSLLSVRESQARRDRSSSDQIRIDAHERIVEAIERHDEEAAKSATIEHLDHLLLGAETLQETVC